VSNRRTGLPVALKMRHNAHYVEEIVSRSGAAIGRMVPIEDLQLNADQPRKDRGDLTGLVESVREKGVLEPLLVRYLAEARKYMIISGERRYHAARAAGLREVPCIEKDADDAETLEIALIENLQRKDLTPFEEADGLQALADRFALTHDEIGHKIGKARSSVTESLSLRAIPDPVKALAIEKGVVSKGQLLQVARQPDEARMKSLVLRFAHGLVNRDQAREERQKKPRATIFTFVAPNENYKLTLKFRKNNVPREEIILALRSILESLEAGS
jgi:ParB family transcriptional regulator, chromosome partitioning protein